MVGVPKIIRCDNCRRRKKKCDIKTPACTACVQSGRKCPGYSKPWKFVDENPTLILQYQKKKYLLEESDLDADAAIDANKALIPTVSSDLFGDQPMIVRGLILWPLISVQDHHAANLVELLENPRSQGVFPLTAHGSFYHLIPGRLGQNDALDSAIACLCGIYRDLLAGNRQTTAKTMRQYSKSLRGLRLYLDDPDRCFQSETICAAIVLQLCELMTNSENGQWNQLSHGTKALIQNSDVRRFQHPFERGMLESQRAFFILQAMRLRQPCFLAESPWRDLLQQPEGPSIPETTGLALRSRLCDWLVDIPLLLQEASTVLHNTSKSKSTSKSKDQYKEDPENTEINEILHRVISMRDQIETWYQNNIIPIIQSPAPDGVAPLRPCAEYPHLLFGVLDCVVNTTLIVLEDLIDVFPDVSGVSGVSQGIRSMEGKRVVLGRRQRTILNGLEYVKRVSPLAAKPLEVGMNRLQAFNPRHFNPTE
ncbi:hypothetical protein BDV25DRAFT_149523 [Aspergillus avenaceus]|uniref:Zn(2)-C6 fungal-type domain-containing protein n=1 Tax=Aspergillus avenaceus TaxID=36643 RepID=A0A5N6U4W6_ASPAV|nr:hypothetical protein BDV25DRAFT_149523 [Aspergillus avenaceus]